MLFLKEGAGRFWKIDMLFLKEGAGRFWNAYRRAIARNLGVKIWFVFSILTILFFAYGICKSEDIPYINYALGISFWGFVLIPYFCFGEISCELRMSAALMLIVGGFLEQIFVGAFLPEYVIPHEDEKKIYDIFYSAIRLVERDIPWNPQNPDSEIKRKEIISRMEEELKKLGQVSDKVYLSIKKDDEICYEKTIPHDIENKYSISQIPDYKSDEDILISCEYAYGLDISKWYINTMTFFVSDELNAGQTYITGQAYKYSLVFPVFFLLVHCLIFSYLFFIHDKSISINELFARIARSEEQRNLIEAKNEELAAQQCELELRNTELQEKNDKLNRFELVYNRMMADVKKTAKYDPVQGLQVVKFNWRDFIDKQISSGRHSLRNNISGRAATEEELRNFEDKLYEMVINPAVESIISQLNKTVDMIDSEPSAITTQDIYDEICGHINSTQFQRSRAEKEHISVRTQYAIAEQRICYVNMHRLKAIVENLCFNTQQAFSRKRDELDDAGDDAAFDNFTVSVGIVFSIAQRQDGEYLCIDYRDNAQGFPDELLPQLYKAPVPSSKGKNRKGEGTMYISFFVEAMKGFIEAENQKDADGRKCAVTKIYIPANAGEEM